MYNQLLEIIFAGSETTANVTAECLYEMSRDPKIQGRLRTEMILFESEHGRFPTYSELGNATLLPHLDAVVKETLRTKSALMEISRTVSGFIRFLWQRI